MNYWGQFPFVRLLIPLILGIITAIYLQSGIDNLFWFLLVLALSYVVLVVFIFKKLKYSWSWLPGIFIMIILFVSGYFLAYQRMPDQQKNEKPFLAKSGNFRIEIIEPLVEKPRSFKTVGSLLNLKDSAGWQASNIKVLIYFEKTEKIKNLEYGDQIIFSGNFQSIAPPKNPGEFNYQRYLFNKGITHQIYVKGNDWSFISKGKGNPLVFYGLAIRTRFLNILASNGISGSEFAVASALLLGYDEYLDREQKRQFAGAGAMHILCVSGLHVGILAFLMEFLLGFLSRKKILRFLKIILLLGTIWLYAAITGFSPSVMRAATMFSFIILGRSLNRKANIFNMLAASAFVLLLINPLLLAEVGFQLSYIAVLGIVMLYRPIYHLFRIRFKILDFAWQISAVSIAATIATLPLSLYYFHQVPVLFFITNLVAIPAATLVIYLGLLVLITSFIPIISSAIAYVLTLVILGLNYSVAWIEGLSFSVITNIYISPVELIVLILLLILIVTFIYSEKKAYGYYAMFMVFVFLLSITTRRIINVQQNKIVVYGTRKSTAIDFIHGKNSIMICDSSFSSDSLLQEFSVKGNWIESGINKSNRLFINGDSLQNAWFYKRGDYVCFLDKRFAVVNPLTKLMPAVKRFDVDYILISNNPRISIQQLTDVFQFKLVIFDLSNPGWKVEQWKAECEQYEIPFYDVQQNGAWVQNI